jgi:thiosulfate reductase cytochrome b subunit
MNEVRHAAWVRTTHWVVALSFLTLAFSGFVVLMAHPRLYWGEVGNDLTPALLELPISRNHRHGGWDASVAFFEKAASPVSANRTYEIFNQNGWARSLHFLAAWFLVVTGLVYVATGLLTGHVRRHLVPRGNDLAPRAIWQDVLNHLRLRIPPATGGPQYGLLQRCTYLGVIFFALPLTISTGLTMSPAITAACPLLLDVFGGYQSARTIHFFAFVALALFLLAHVAMIVASGFRRQMRAMTLGH